MCENPEKPDVDKIKSNRYKLPKGIYTFLDEAGLRFCPRCDTIISKADFWKRQSYCKKCMVELQRTLPKLISQAKDPVVRRSIIEILHIKPCTCCGQILPLEFFYTDSHTKIHYHYRCKECYRNKNRPKDMLSREWLNQWYDIQGKKLMSNGFLTIGSK